MGLNLKGLINPENGYYVYKVTTAMGQESFLKALLAQSGVKGTFGQYRHDYYLVFRSEPSLKDAIESKSRLFVSPIDTDVPKGKLAIVDNSSLKREILVGIGVLKLDRGRISINPQAVHQFM